MGCLHSYLIVGLPTILVVGFLYSSGTVLMFSTFHRGSCQIWMPGISVIPLATAWSTLSLSMAHVIDTVPMSERIRFCSSGTSVSRGGGGSPLALACAASRHNVALLLGNTYFGATILPSVTFIMSQLDRVHTIHLTM